MKNTGAFTKILATIGTILVWLPILAPILFGMLRFIQSRRFRFDYLMPAELFFLVLVGGGLLIWAALRARSRLGLVGWGLGIAVVLLVGSQAIAVVSGLASGEIEPAGIWWVLTLAGIVGYALMVVVIGVGGVLLMRDLFATPRLPSPTA